MCIYVYIELLKLFGDVKIELTKILLMIYLGSFFGGWKHEMQIIPWGLDGSTHASRRSLENRSFAHFTYLECWISSQPVGVNGPFRVSHQFFVDANRIRYT